MISMLKRIMKKAHRIAKKMEGDYQARLSLALKLAWKEERGNGEMIKWKGEEVKVTGKMEKRPENLENKVYCNINTKDEAIAKENNRVYVTYTSDYKVWFDGDTYNQKDEIQELAKKYKVKASWTGKH